MNELNFSSLYYGMNKIQLTQGFEAIVDEADYELLSRYKWWYQDVGSGYARGTVDGRKVYMHRFLLSPGESEVDHINGYSLDNRRSNLRICSRTENCRNKGTTKGEGRNLTSRYKGLARTPSGKWRVEISCGDKRINVGLFDDEYLAAKAYDLAALEHFGSFARLNFNPVSVSRRVV